MNLLKSTFAAGLAATALIGAGTAAMAAPVNQTSNVIFIVDESGSMGGEQAFLLDVIDDLDTDLGTAGVVNRSYGVVGFGRSAGSGNPVGFGSAPALDNLAGAQASLAALQTSGSVEDGYEAINYALNNFNFTAGAAVNFVLVTDEDRDNTSADSFATISAALKSRNILLNAVVNASFSSDLGAGALGVDDSGEAYRADGAGDFTTDTNGVATGGSGNTVADYVDLALGTGGAAWDLNQLRSGGLVADSFTKSFLSIKVAEITTQPPVSAVPVPAGILLMGTALAGFGVMRRRKKTA